MGTHERKEQPMSTPNFITQPGFPLMILDDTDYEFPVCPECGGWMEQVNGGKWTCTACEYETDDVDHDCETEFDELLYEDMLRFFEPHLDRFNETLTFFKVTFRSGYYRGVQAYVTWENDPHDLYNSECRYYWDMCRSQAIRKYEAEQRRVAKYLKGLRKEGLKELRCVGVFSNGEAVYEYVN